MTDIQEMRKTLVKRVLQGPGKASSSERRAAFDNDGLVDPLAALVDKVARRAYSVTDEDLSASSGHSEDQIFELMVCAAIGQAARQYDAALAALEAATGKE